MATQPGLHRAALALLAALLSAAHAGAQFTATATNDWDSHVDDQLAYSHAVNIGDTDVTVNNVVFDQYLDLGTTGVDNQSGQSFSIFGPSATSFGSLVPFDANITGQSAGLTPGFVWGGDSASSYALQLNDLTIGQAYQLTLFQAAWNDSGVHNREVNLTANGIALGQYDVQSGGIEPDGTRNGTVVTLGYTPSSSSVTFNLDMTPQAGSTPHVQAFSNHEIASAPPLPSLNYPTFINATAAVGLQDYRATAGDLHSPGAVFTDLDNDSYPDLYVVRNDSTAGEHNQLYLNKSNGSGGRVFQLQDDALGALNVTGGTLSNNIGVTGAVAADYDNDGDTDLYVTNMGGPNRLYQSQLTETGSLSFVDKTNVARVTGLTGSQHSLTAAWADPDRDGDLDLYVGSHDKWGNSFDGERDTYYRNNGDGTFTDATFLTPGDPLSGYLTESGGVTAGGQTHSDTNAVIFADFNNDQWPDLLVTNKSNKTVDRDMLYINRGNHSSGSWLGFETATYQPEMANSFGINWADSAMGVDVEDIDNDGDLDIIISDNPSFGPRGPNDIFINQLTETGILSFEHRDVSTGLSWGVQLADFDNNGYVEAHITNDTSENSGRSALLSFLDPTNPLTSPITDVATLAGVENQNGNDRGNVVADYNRDGKLDLFVVNLNNDPRFSPSDLASVLYENTTENDNGFLSIKLVGDPTQPTAEGFATSRDAIGSRVFVQADLDGDGDPETMLREVRSGSGNAASTSSLELSFGLGMAESAEVTILWADGRYTELGEVTANQFLMVDQSNLIGLPGDFNSDGVVDSIDYAVWRENLGAADESGIHHNGNGQGGVDQADFGIWLAHYGETVSPALPTTPAPEPSCLLLLAFWAAGLSGRLFAVTREV